MGSDIKFSSIDFTSRLLKLTQPTDWASLPNNKERRIFELFTTALRRFPILPPWLPSHPSLKGPEANDPSSTQIAQLLLTDAKVIKMLREMSEQKNLTSRAIARFLALKQEEEHTAKLVLASNEEAYRIILLKRENRALKQEIESKLDYVKDHNRRKADLNAALDLAERRLIQKESDETYQQMVQDLITEKYKEDAETLRLELKDKIYRIKEKLHEIKVFKDPRFQHSVAIESHRTILPLSSEIQEQKSSLILQKGSENASGTIINEKSKSDESAMGADHSMQVAKKMKVQAEAIPQSERNLEEIAQQKQREGRKAYKNKV